MGYLAAGALNGVAYAFFAVFCFAVYCAICLRHRLDPIRIFAIAIACECFASIAGIQFCMVARDAGIDLGTILVFLSALLAVTFLFLFSDAQYRSDWGTKRSRPSVDSVIKYYYTLPDVCTALAKQYGLSKREETVLQLLAQKRLLPTLRPNCSFLHQRSKLIRRAFTGNSIYTVGQSCLPSSMPRCPFPRRPIRPFVKRASAPRPVPLPGRGALPMREGLAKGRGRRRRFRRKRILLCRHLLGMFHPLIHRDSR